MCPTFRYRAGVRGNGLRDLEFLSSLPVGHESRCDYLWALSSQTFEQARAQQDVFRRDTLQVGVLLLGPVPSLYLPPTIEQCTSDTVADFHKSYVASRHGLPAVSACNTTAQLAMCTHALQSALDHAISVLPVQ